MFLDHLAKLDSTNGLVESEGSVDSRHLLDDADLDDNILFCDEDDDENRSQSPSLPAPSVSTTGNTGEAVWKALIIDDEPMVHRATQLALNNLEFDGKRLIFISAYSAAEAKAMLASTHADAAFILLDVVMETKDAGFQVIQYIRDSLKNQRVRIILRTGQPGDAPEESIILNYDINDYKLKVDLTRQRLLTTTISALRAYRDIVTIEQQNHSLLALLQDLSQTKNKLEDYAQCLEMKVAERTAALEMANRQLHRLATLDGLTRVANRRRFEEYWQQQWLHLGQQQEPLSVVLLDVDYFKYYNDHYGHQAGDECLCTIAQQIQALLKRSADLVARYGGEEFVIVLPNTPLEGAQRVAEEVRLTIYGLNLPHVASQVSDRVTVSLGIACVVPQPDISSKMPIAIADRALYQAKQAGRNRYAIYGHGS